MMLFGLLLFAESNLDWVDKFGPSGIAGMVMVWLTHRHEKVIKDILTSNENNISKLNTTLEKINVDSATRNSESKQITEKQIETIGNLAKGINNIDSKLQALIDENKDLQRRLEMVERLIPGLQKEAKESKEAREK